MFEVDARNLECPAPVMLTKNNFRKLANGEQIKVLVDNETAMNNVKRALERLETKDVSVEKQAENLFVITAIKFEQLAETESCAAKSEQLPVFYLITRETFGQETGGLGAKLIDSFLGVIFGEETKPAGIFLINQGVKLACEGSHSLEILLKLVDKGVDVMSCGLCLKEQKLTEKLKVGKISAMPDLVNAFKNYRIITIG